jgi:SNF2 family DNA or RNA helicase
MWLQVEQDAANGDASAEAFVKAALVDGVNPSNLYRIPNGAARMVRLQQILETPAILGAEDTSGSFDDFEQKFADSRPEQWMVFCKFKPTCDILAERLRTKYDARVAVYTGDVSPEDRTAIEDAFQRGELDVVIGTIAAMREGITMTAGRLQFWLTRDWVPAVNEQGESRQDRIGQQREVIVYIPQPENSVATDNVAPTNRLKERIVSTVIAKDDIKEVIQ